MRSLFKILLFILLTGNVACGIDSNEYSRFENIPDAGWGYGDTLIFEPVVSDAVVTGTLSIAIRHNNDYLYSNLWVELSHVSTGDSVAEVDTLNITLADIYGRWHGNGTGVLYQLSDTVATGFKLTRGCRIKVRHIMRDDLLTGIEQVGIIFNPDK